MARSESYGGLKSQVRYFSTQVKSQAWLCKLLIPALAGVWEWQRHQAFVACHPRQKDDLTRHGAIKEATEHPAMAPAYVHMGVYTQTLAYTQHTPTCVCHTATLHPFPQFLKSRMPTKDV